MAASGRYRSRFCTEGHSDARYLNLLFSLTVSVAYGMKLCFTSLQDHLTNRNRNSMTDFSKEDLAVLLSKIQDFVRNEVYPLEREFLLLPFRDLVPTLNEKRQQVKALGLWAPHLPREYGGLDLKLSDFAHVSEELGRTPIGHYLFNCQAPDIGNTEILMAHATPDQKERYLWPLVRGEIRSCFSMTEPEHPGSNPTWMSTYAVKDGPDYVINGHKWFTSSAEGASFAIVMAITNPEAESPYKRASQIIVPTDA